MRFEVALGSISAPEDLISVARKLEDMESPMNPVCGDLVQTTNFEEVVICVPTRGLVQNTKGFSGPSGSAPCGQY